MVLYKLIIFTIIALYYLITIVIAPGSVTIKFIRPFLLYDSYAQVMIESVDADLSRGIDFQPKPSLNDILSSPVRQLWSFDLSNRYFYQLSSYGTIFNGVYSHCIDPITMQPIAYLESNHKTGGFSLFPIDINAYLYKYNEFSGYGKFELLCAIKPLPPKPQSENLSISFYSKGDDSTKPSFNTPLLCPDFIKPLIKFHHLNLLQLPADQRSSSVIDISFSTNSTGAFLITTHNAPSFSPVSLTTGQEAPYWCSSTNNQQFARIQYSPTSTTRFLTIFIPHPTPSPKDRIHCTFYLTNDHNNDEFIHSSRSALSISHGGEIVTKTFDFNLRLGYFQAQFQHITHTSFSLSLLSSPLTLTSTPININSTIEFRFGRTINVNFLTLNNPSIKQSYRGFTGCNNIGLTLHLNSKTNSILLSHFPHPIRILNCTFQFDSVKAFAFDKKQGSVELLIDNRHLQSRFTQGTVAPLYIRPLINITSTLHTETLLFDSQQQHGSSMEFYQITDVFTISDQFHILPISPTKPIIIFSLIGDLGFNFENHPKQLTCTITSPSHSKPKALQLQFDPTTLTWSAELKSIINVQTFSIILTCLRSREKLFHFGLEITPISSLRIEIIDLIDDERFFESTIITTTENEIIQSPTQPTLSSHPPTARYHVEFISTLQLPQDVSPFSLYLASLYPLDLIPALIQSYRPPNSTTPYYQDYTLTPTGSPSYSFPSAMESISVNFSSASHLKSYHESLHNDFLPFPVQPPISFRTANTQPHLHSTQVTYATTKTSQYYLVQNAQQWDGDPDFSASAPVFYWYNQDKILGQDFVFATNPDFIIEVPKQNHSFWANPIDKCGYIDGMHLLAPGPAYEYIWSNYSQHPQILRRLCHKNEPCTMSADCEPVDTIHNGSKGLTVCQSSVCTLLPQINSPIFRFNSTIYRSFDPRASNSIFSSSSLHFFHEFHSLTNIILIIFTALLYCEF